MNVIRLRSEHLQAFRKLRLKALREFPEAFVASYEEEVEQPDSFFLEKLTGDTSFYGAFLDGQLIGMISFMQSSLLKMNHKAHIGSVYVAKQARGNKVGKELLNEMIECAKERGVEQLQLVVASTNKKAKQLYESLGFKRFGFEQKALKVDGMYINEEHMALEVEK